MAVSRIMSKRKGRTRKLKCSVNMPGKSLKKVTTVPSVYTHIADYMEFGAGWQKKVYLNTGDFIRKLPILSIPEEVFSLKEYKPLIRGI